MYVPSHFALADREALISFIEAHPFGVFVSLRAGKPFATHVPFVVLDCGEPLKLGLHVARANPQWQDLQESDVLAIFHGAHDFISASWYERPQDSVPTWNYSAVHCAGTAALTDDAGTQIILETMVDHFEGSGRWSMGNADAAYVERMKRGIVGIEVAVSSIDGKLKYSQNRSEEDRASVLAHLEESASPLAVDMRKHFE